MFTGHGVFASTPARVLLVLTSLYVAAFVLVLGFVVDATLSEGGGGTD